MQYRIISKPSYSLVEVCLDGGEEIIAEAGVMAYMKNVDIITETRGIGGALKRSLLGGESFFLNRFRCNASTGLVGLAPRFPGDVELVEMNNNTLYVQSGSFLAGAPTINIDTKWSGAKGFFSGEGLFLLKITGNGGIFLSSFGGIEKIDLQGDEITVDTGHIVAFTDGLEWSVGKAGNLKSFLFSGEGLVARFRGVGSIWIQTRTLDSFLDYIATRIQKDSGKSAIALGLLGGILKARE